MNSVINKARRVLSYFFQPDLKKIKNIIEFSNLVDFINFDVSQIDVPGWLSIKERKALYGLARWLPGPFLEIGPWVGLSTIIISIGIEDSKTSKQFITAEINPRLQNYRAFDNGIGFFIPPNAPLPRGVSSIDIFEKHIKPVLLAKDGVIGELQRNLLRYGQMSRVEIFEGHFKDVKKMDYRLVFSDAMHDANEITENVEVLKQFLSPNCILACHDTTPENEVLLTRLIKFKEYTKFDSLFVGKVE